MATTDEPTDSLNHAYPHCPDACMRIEHHTARLTDRLAALEAVLTAARHTCEYARYSPHDKAWAEVPADVLDALEDTVRAADSAPSQDDNDDRNA